jgi:hypothetical protein
LYRSQFSFDVVMLKKSYIDIVSTIWYVWLSVAGIATENTNPHLGTPVSILQLLCAVVQYTNLMHTARYHLSRTQNTAHIFTCTH